jgi:hypothetical protein
MAKSLLAVKTKKRKTITPRGLDAKHLGQEPTWENVELLSESDLRAQEANAYNWYNYFYEAKEGRGFIIEFMEQINMPKAAIAMLKRVPDAQLNSTTAAMARMYVMGLESVERRKKIEARIMELCRRGAKLYEEDRKHAAVKAKLPEKAYVNELIAHVEDMIDADSDQLDSIYDWLKARNAKPTDVRGLADYYTPWLNELNEAAERTPDPQLKEAYSHFTKKALKERIQLFAGIISDCESYLSNSR